LNYKQQVILLIAGAVLFKLALGGQVELNNDEAYYWTYARHLQWNYFDHPPMVALFIRVFSLNLHAHQEIFLRLPGIVTAAASTWIIFKTGILLKDQLTGLIAAFLFTASFYAAVIAGLLILPDTPQLLFWTASVYLLLDIIKRESLRRPVSNRLLLAGLAIGLCILSKVHGVFLWAGFLGYCFFDRRSLLKHPSLYAGMGISLLLLAPSLWWTFGNHFSNYNYHSARVNFRHLHMDSLFREIAGELLYNNPVNTFLLVLSMLLFRKNYNGAVLLKWLSLPLILTVIGISLFNDTLPHWSGPAYSSLTPLTALYLRTNIIGSAIPRAVRWSLSIAAAALVISVLIINGYPGTLGEKKMPEWGRGDVTLDMSGWRQITDSLQQHLGPDTPASLITNFWFPGGHLDFYASHQLGIPVRVVGSLNDIHHFAWLNPKLAPLQQGQNAWFITLSNFLKKPPPLLLSCFRNTAAPLAIPQFRSGRIVRYLYLYRLEGYTGGLPQDGILP